MSYWRISIEYFVASLKWQHQRSIDSSSSPYKLNMKNLHICNDIWKDIYFEYVTKYLMRFSWSTSLLWQRGCNLSDYWICDTFKIQWFSCSLNVSYSSGRIVPYYGARSVCMFDKVFASFFTFDMQILAQKKMHVGWYA